MKLVGIFFSLDNTCADLTVLYICSILKKQRYRINNYHSRNQFDDLANNNEVCVGVGVVFTMLPLI